MIKNQLSPRPWYFEQYNNDNSIIAANGKNIMCDMQYYPWCPNVADMKLIIAAVNAYKVEE